MQIRRYTGADLPEVLDRVHRELGPNAAILNTRRISEGGFFGMLGKPAYEVTVAVDYDFRLAEDAGNGVHPDAPPQASFPRPGARRTAAAAPPASDRSRPGPVLPSRRSATGGAPHASPHAAPRSEDALLAARRELAER